MMTDVGMPPSGHRLLPGEQVIWRGAPFAGLMTTGRDWFLIPFSVLWLVFSIVWLSTAALGGAPLPFILWGVPFVCIGLFIGVGRFFFDAWCRRRTSYVVTDRRVLISRLKPLATVVSLGIRDLPDVRLLNGTAAARGTIRFGVSPSIFSGTQGLAPWIPALDPTPQFIGIADANEVFDLIVRLQHEPFRS